MGIDITWLGHASVLVSTEKKIIYFDPWKLKPSMPKADIIIVSHDHHDHYSELDIREISKADTRVVAPMKAALVTDVVKTGSVLDIDGTIIQAVPAYNIGKAFHPKSSEWAGFVVTTEGKSIYHAGDTDRVPEMKNIKCDIALLPSGGTFTMTSREAAAAAGDVKASVAIPIHWGDIVGTMNDAEDFKKHADCNVHILKKDESISLD